MFLSKNLNALETIAKQAMLYDLDTRSVIFKKNSDQLVSPSSMSKGVTYITPLKKFQMENFLLK